MQISLRDLTKHYGAVRALDRVWLEIAPGQVVALLGANGAGKTTLLRCLAGLVASDQGRILLNGEPLERERIDLRRRLAFVPDFPFVLPEMTVLQHAGMVLKIYGAPQEDSARRLLDLLRRFDLLPLVDVPFQALSRGQAYKGALVALLAADPEVWLVDEPFASGMDPNGLAAFKDIAVEAASRGRTILYSTQILDIAERFSDRVCIFERGQVRAYDTPAELRARSTGKDGFLEAIFRKLREEDGG
ncbi:MAG TPA: ABC transporter ATP-binding protein [Planctomycetota bacterium]|nr:ABC transporter ATP-binding protein [Planctomycetota bacterium]